MSALEIVDDVTDLEIVIPVHNEEQALPVAIDRLTEALTQLPWTWRVTIADNGSQDATALVARRLSREYAGVAVSTLTEKGRGRALKQVWSGSTARVLVYMDVDLSTDLRALPPLVAPLLSGHSDLAIGSRLHPAARVVRGPKREFVSRGYNLLLRATLRSRFSDAQCGFKAVRADVAARLLPWVADDTWFFDTELLVLAERAGMRIHEVPVDWVDDPDSRVDIVKTAADDLRGIARLGWSLLRGHVPLAEVGDRVDVVREKATDRGRLGSQAALFVCVGILSTLAYAVLFLGFRQTASAQVANLLALLLTAITNTALNRRFTFGVRGRADAARHQVQGLAVFGFGWLITSGSLWVLGDRGSHAVEIAVLTVANLVATVVRFVAMRWWIFRHRARTHPDGPRSVVTRARSGGSG